MSAKISAEYLDHMGSDLTVVNATRVSSRLTDMLHKYKHKAQHWTPFAHPHVQIRMTLPIFLARQFVKHQVGGVWSEESRRYISDDPEVWYPDTWHAQSKDIKQDSDGSIRKQSEAAWNAENAVYNCINSYRDSLSIGVVNEEARITLPLNIMTTVVWTGSLEFWARVCNQYSDSRAKLPAQELGKIIASIIEPLFPVSWKHLTT
jgi:thymidylate synthase (FAD)